jgi:hypothetical protein
MLWSIGLYFILGFILDVVITLQQRAVIMGARLSAASLSMVITAISIFLLQSLIKSDDIILTFAYIFGTGLGTLIGMFGRQRKEKQCLSAKIAE